MAAIYSFNEAWMYLLFLIVPIYLWLWFHYMSALAITLFSESTYSKLSKTTQVKINTKLLRIYLSVVILVLVVYMFYLLLSSNPELSSSRDVNESLATDVCAKLAVIHASVEYCLEIFNNFYYKMKLHWSYWIHHIISCVVIILIYTPFTSELFYSRVWMAIFGGAERFPLIILDICSFYYYFGENDKTKKIIYKIASIFYLSFTLFQICAVFLFVSNKNTLQIITIILLEFAILPTNVHFVISVRGILKHIDEQVENEHDENRSETRTSEASTKTPAITLELCVPDESNQFQQNVRSHGDHLRTNTI